ncbi:class D sortase [Bacillus gobiensis]|uniref:class D sortase n=1 Tax=Bacillus gobiensis TaxID=1441095 RepID=UPI003D1CE95D
MKKMKVFSLLLIACGLAFAGYGIWKIVDGNIKTGESMAQAKEVINKPSGKENTVESFTPTMGEAVGILSIPRLETELPIVEGTDPDDLEKGVGHYKGSFYPDQNGQIVMSGHRDTVFRRTGELEIGDSLKIQLSYGTFEYKITDTKIVDQNDTSVITLQHEKEELILTTCYPFSYVGNAPDRYIIYAERK